MLYYIIFLLIKKKDFKCNTKNMPSWAYFSCSRGRTGWGRWQTPRTRPSEHVLQLQGEGQDEGGSEHIKHAQMGVFYVFGKGKDRVGEVTNT
jgi:hypothetical protein